MNCLHGMQREWCAICRGDVRAIPQGRAQCDSTANGDIASEQLVNVLFEIGAKPSFYSDDKRTNYKVLFHKRHADKVRPLTNCVLSICNASYLELSCKDAFLKLQERYKA